MTNNQEDTNMLPMSQVMVDHFPHGYSPRYGDGLKIMCSCDENFTTKEDWANHVQGAWMNKLMERLVPEPHEGKQFFQEAGEYFGRMLELHADLREEYAKGNSEPHMKATNQIITAEANGMRMAGRWLQDKQDHPPRYIPVKTITTHDQKLDEIINEFGKEFL